MAKAGRPKKGSAGLPEWFDIEQYRDVKNFRTINWYQQFAVRFLINNLLQSNPFGEEQLVKLCALLKQNPILTVERLLETLHQGQGENHQPGQPRSIYLAAYVAMTRQVCSVADATNMDIFTTYSNFPENIKEYLSDDNLEKVIHGSTFVATPDGFAANLTEADALMKKDCNDLPEGQMPFAGCWTVKVNILLPEEVLMREFEAYIRQKRSKYSRLAAPFFRNPEFDDWYNNGYLPYLDLLLLDRKKDSEVRWPAFADALNQISDTPVSSDGALAKANKANALKLIHVLTIQMLAIQAAREKTGTLKESGKFIVR
jgi:Family of unknown function (DUF6387)